MKFQKFFALLLMACATPLLAQPEEVPFEADFMMEAAPAGAGPGEVNKFLFISADVEHGGKTIKGAPYSAEALTERTQTLADGNRIVSKSTASVYRDSEGRTRREQQIQSIGNWESTEKAPSIVFIHDPVANIHYVLEPDNNVARKMNMEKTTMESSTPDGKKKFEKQLRHAPAPHAMGHAEAGFGGDIVRYKFSDKDAKKESLGKQTIEGLSVEGTRTTITIPAGQMGNELPIQIVSERWYSPDLQVHVLTRHSDPRFGETVYQLTQIARGEPDRSLFEVPKGYKMEDSPIHHKIRRKTVVREDSNQ